MSRSGICRAIQRVARKAEATWHALREAARRSQLAHRDETGWKVEAQLRWLWAVVTEQITYMNASIALRFHASSRAGGGAGFRIG